MSQRASATTFGPAVPELPVADVERAQQHYRDALGFEIGWLYPGGGIGAVSRGSRSSSRADAGRSARVGHSIRSCSIRRTCAHVPRAG
jgi:hypothetical protein